MKTNTQSSEIEISICDSVNKYDFLLVPTANAIAGAVGFGLPGAIAGVAAGVTDEILVSYGWTNGRYLSPVIHGASSFATLTSSWTIRGVGALLSLTFSQLATSEYNKYVDKIISPTQIAVQGGYVFGWKGAVGGMALGSVEEVFIYYKVYNKHYISTAASYVSVTHLLKKKTGTFVSYCMGSKLNIKLASLKKLVQKAPYFLEGISAAAGLVKSIYEVEEENVITVLELQKDIGEIYKKLGKEVEYFDMLEKQTLTASGLAVVEQISIL